MINKDNNRLYKDNNRSHNCTLIIFKKLIQDHRPQLDIEKVSTGEIWLGEEALQLQLVDGITTSDDYLSSSYHHANLYELRYQTKKSLSEKIFSSGTKLLEKNVIQDLAATPPFYTMHPIDS